MPIFGLVWVASWVSCFFSSSQDLLRAPSYQAHVSPIQVAYRTSDSHSTLLANFSRDRHDLVLPFSHRVQPLAQTDASPLQVSSLAAAFQTSDTVVASPIDFLGTVKSLFSSLQKLTAAKPSLAVTVTQSKPEQAMTETVGLTHTAGVGFGQCLPIAPTSTRAHDSSGKAPPMPFFQVKVKNYIVSSTRDRKEATRIAQRLEQALGEANPNVNQLQPGIVGGVPVGKLGDRVLFSVDRQTADQWDCNPEMLAIQWVNELRVAMAQTPLSFAEAQTKMYGLQETGERLEGTASWYGPYFHGRQTATGETFNQYDFTAAHPSLPFNTYLKVTNLANGKAVIVRVNDRGPYFEDRTLDLSREAARCLGSETDGVVTVEAQIMQPIKSASAGSQAIAQRL